MMETISSISDAQYAIDAINYYYDHPPAFVREIMGAVPDDWEGDSLMELVNDHFLAIKSGSGVGKTTLMSWAIEWFLFTRPFSKVPCTAPSSHQLFDILWSKLYKWLGKSHILRNFFEWTQTKLAVKGHEPNWFAVARTSRVQSGSEVAEGLQGFHDEKNLLFVLDEASGIPDAVYPAVEGALTGEGCYALLTGNPTRTTGFFHDIFRVREMAKFYRHRTVSCYDSPRVSKRYIEMMEARYGKEHPVFQIKVLGEFPTADESLLVPPDYLDTMINNGSVDCKGFPVEFGVDVGRSNASSILCVRRGYEILKWDERGKKGLVTDTLEIVRWVADYIAEYKPTSVKIDSIGIGAGVHDVLKETYGDMIVAVIGSASPGEEVKGRYLNLRAQGYWELRELTPHLYCAKWPDRLIAELGDIRTKTTTNQRIKIESKEDMLDRAMKSPDYADAMYMAFLDSQLCTGIVPLVYTPPLQVLNVNKDFKKVPRWSMLKNRPSRRSRWRSANG